MTTIRNDNTIFLSQECVKRYPNHKFDVAYIPNNELMDTYIVAIDDTINIEIILLGNPKYVLHHFFDDIDKGIKKSNIKRLTDKL